MLLERYMEPLTALAWLAGGDVPEGTPALAWHAWHWLLLNHPHDDMYGSGIDEVHHEMLYRFSQARQIAGALVRDSLREVARQADMTAQTGTPVIAFNPLGWDRAEIAAALIEFEFDDPHAESFQLVTAAGEVVPHQVLENDERFWMEVLKPNRKRCVRVLVPVNVPALGYTTLYAQPAAGGAPPATDLVAASVARRALVALAIGPTATTLTDKATGHTYTGQHHLSTSKTRATGTPSARCRRTTRRSAPRAPRPRWNESRRDRAGRRSA